MKKLLLSLICFIASIVCYAQTLYIYGGSDHDVFLGCLNSNKYDSKSIWNEYGTYGSKYNSKSIWNEYGTYGSSYSAYSPWNNYASYPPVIVDEEGNFYGYLTVNQYKYNRADFSLAKYLYEYYDVIRDNVGNGTTKSFIRPVFFPHSMLPYFRGMEAFPISLPKAWNAVQKWRICFI